MSLFQNRSQAGQLLGQSLKTFPGLRARRDILVLGLPRGGVPVAFEVAKALDAALDVVVVRKLGVPWHPELAFGAIGPQGVQVIHEELRRDLSLSDKEIGEVVAAQNLELARRMKAYRPSAEPLDCRGRVIVLVDDGIATGATMEAAVKAVRLLGASMVVVAVPVAPKDAEVRLAALTDAVVCLHCPDGFTSVGEWYDHFEQTSDAEVTETLRQYRPVKIPPTATAGAAGTAHSAT